MHMIPVTDPEELKLISAWAAGQKADPLIPGWATWKFIDDSGKFYGFYQQGARVCGNFHVDTGGDRVRSIRAVKKVEDFYEATGVTALFLVPSTSPLHPVMQERHTEVNATPFACGARK